MPTPSDSTFNDYEDDGPDDTDALEAYAAELAAAVEAFELDVKEPGHADR